MTNTPTTHAVVGDGIHGPDGKPCPDSVIQEGLRDVLKPGDSLALPWYGRPTDSLAAVYDYALDNNVPFIMYHREDLVPGKALRDAETGTTAVVVDTELAVLKALGPKGKVLFLWNDDTAKVLVPFVFENSPRGTLVLELTNGLAPVSLSLAAESVSPPVEAEATAENYDEVDPTDDTPVDDSSPKFTEAELNGMPVANLKKMAMDTGNWPATAHLVKPNYIKVILGQELPDASFATPQNRSVATPVTIADSDPTQPAPSGWSPAVGDDAKQKLRDSLYNRTPTPEQVTTIEAYREVAITLGDFIVDNIPVGRNRSLAITALEDVVMRGVKGILLDQ